MRHRFEVVVGLSLLAAACGAPPEVTIDGFVPPVADAGAPDVALSPDAPLPPDAALPDAVPPDAAPPDAGPLPDLFVNEGRLVVDLAVETKTFADDACELVPDESCVGAPGDRQLLRFSIETPNQGTGDLFMGIPSADNPLYVYSECHRHFHFNGYAEYDLLDAEGNSVAPGQKQAFCLLDFTRFIDDPTVPTGPMYNCGFQGIQRGWSDVYGAHLPCQWIDITDTPPGDYTLRVTLNSARAIEELDYDNNVFEYPVRIGDPTLLTPDEPCPTGYDAHATRGLHRECGWDFAGTWDCEPGRRFRIGCSSACTGLGSCEGDPILRLCDAASASGSCTSPTNLAANDDSCGSDCPRVKDIICPSSGQVVLYTAAATLGDTYSCEIAFEYQD